MTLIPCCAAIKPRNFETVDEAYRSILNSQEIFYVIIKDKHSEAALM